MARGRPSKKQLILDTAKNLFAARGLQGTSIDLVVQEAGVSKPTVYNNFPTKSALLEELIQQLTSELSDALQALKSDSISVDEKVIKAYSWVAERPEHLMIFRIWYGEAHKLDKSLLSMLESYETKLLDHCEDVLKSSIEQSGKIEQEAKTLLVKSVCRELILVPALSGSEKDNSIFTRVNQLIAQAL